MGMSSVPAASLPDITDDALFLAPCGPPPGGTVILLRSKSLFPSLLSTLVDTGVSFTVDLPLVIDVLVSFEYDLWCDLDGVLERLRDRLYDLERDLLDLEYDLVYDLRLDLLLLEYDLDLLLLL